MAFMVAFLESGMLEIAFAHADDADLAHVVAAPMAFAVPGDVVDTFGPPLSVEVADLLVLRPDLVDLGLGVLVEPIPVLLYDPHAYGNRIHPAHVRLLLQLLQLELDGPLPVLEVLVEVLPQGLRGDALGVRLETPSARVNI